jgi:signal transduction histidine kinase
LPGDVGEARSYNRWQLSVMRPVALRTVATIAVLVLVAACDRTRREPAPLATTTVRVAKELLRTVGIAEHDVQLRGWVTAVDAENGIVYLQDATGAVALASGDLGPAATYGNEVLLSGRLSGGSPVPRLREAHVTVLGQGNPEVAVGVRPVGAEQLASRAAEAEWVETHAVVRSVTTRNGALILEAEEEGRRFHVMILHPEAPYPTLVGSRVRLRGVSTARSSSAPGIDLLAPQETLLRIEQDAAVETPESSGLPLLTTAAEVRRLTSAEAARGYPIRLRAIVTFSEPEQALLFVDDGTAGIYVEAWRHIHHVVPGDRVEILGRTGAGSFAPIVDRPRVTVLGHGDLPPARTIRVDELLTGQADSQWVEVEGVARTVKLGPWGATIRVAAGPASVPVGVPHVADASLAGRVVNARVRVRGVARSILTRGNQLAAIAFEAPDMRALTILTPPVADPFSLPVRPINALLQFLPGQKWEHAVHVRGVVVHAQPGAVYVRDDTASVPVHTGSTARVAVGDIVDVVGFAALGDYKPMLQDADIRAVGKGAAPEPVGITPEQALTGQFDAALVRLEGRLVDVVGGEQQQLILRAGAYPFSATLHGEVPQGLRAGSGVRLTGICAVSANDYRVPQSFRLLLRDAGDVEVIQAAPWWNAQRSAWAAVVLACAVGLALTWVVTLRRRVSAQSAVIWQRVKHETELQERQRMARELHDTLEQNLVAVGLCVQAAGKAMPAPSKAAERYLQLAIEQVNGAIEGVQRSVWALRGEPLDTRGLRDALAEIGEQLASCSPTPIDVRTRVVGGPRPFAVPVENDLLRIGQEALTNAVRHGKATHIAVDLHYEDETFRLRVSDDGRGFDADVKPHAGHFGLVGMRERAQAIGGTLSVRSAVGRGTEIEVTVPLRPLTLSRAG